MTFAEQIETIYQSILDSYPTIQNRLEKNKTIIFNMLHSHKHREFKKDLLNLNDIRHPLCQAINQNLIDASDIYILSAFISNLSLYKINLNYLKTQYSHISIAMVNCEKDSNILI